MDIDLKSQLALLKSLQDIDVFIHQIDKQLQEIPVKINDAAQEFNVAKAAIDVKQSEKEALEKQKRAADLELEAQIERVRERESRLFAIKTNKEYQAAIKEIADAKQSNREREELVIQLMEKISALNEEITQLSSGVADKEEVFRAKEAELKKSEEVLLKDKAVREADTKDIVSKIDTKLLKQYRFIQTRYPDALAVATFGTCGGCNKKIPPQVYIELQKWKELISCPNCRRLLFFEEKAKAEGENV